MFFAGSQLPRKFVPCFLQEAGFLASSCRVTITAPVSDIERQMKLEADAVHDGLLRYAQSYEYQLATDSKPVRDLLGHCLKPLAEAIRAEQLELKTSQRQKPRSMGSPFYPSILKHWLSSRSACCSTPSPDRNLMKQRRRASLRFHTKSANAAAL